MKRLIGILIVIATFLVLASVTPSMATITERPNVDEISLRRENEEKIVDLSKGNGDELGQIKPYVEQGAAIIYFNGWYAPPKPLLDIGMQTDDGEITWGFGKNDGIGSVVGQWPGFDENGFWTLRASGGIPIQEGSHTFKVVAKFTDETTKVFHSAHYYNNDEIVPQWGNISTGLNVGQWLKQVGDYSAAAFTANAPFAGVKVPQIWASSETVTFDLSLFTFESSVATSLTGTPVATTRIENALDMPAGAQLTFDELPAGQYVFTVEIVDGESDSYIVLPESGDPEKALYVNNLSGEDATKTFNFGIKTTDFKGFFGPVPLESTTGNEIPQVCFIDCMLINKSTLDMSSNNVVNQDQIEIQRGDRVYILGLAAKIGTNLERVIWTFDGIERECSDTYRDRTEIAGLSSFAEAGWTAQDFVNAGFGFDNEMMELLDVNTLIEGTYTVSIIARFEDGTESVIKDSFTLVVGDGGVQPPAPNTTPRITIESVSGRSGDTVNVIVSIENNPGIIGATIKLYYANGLTLAHVENGNVFGNLTVPNNLRSGCTLTWDEIDINPEDVITNGTVMTLTFSLVQGLNDNAFLPISIEYESGDIIDLNLEYVELEIENGGITVFNYVPGDVNNDGRINSLDVIMIRRYIVDGCTTDPEGYNISLIEAAADVNDDGRINSLDVIMIRRYIADGCVTDPSGYNIVLVPSSHFSGSGTGNGGQQNDDPDDPPTDASGLSYTNNGDGTCTVTGMGSCTETDLIIPETLDGLTVVEIGFKAFFEQTGLTSVSIPETVTTIGARAFYGCTGLTEITIPASVNSIGTQILYKADNIHTVYYNTSCYPYNATENPILSNASIKKVIFGGESVWYYAARNLGLTDHVEEIVICEGIELIDIYAFSDCTSLATVTLPNSLAYLGDYAFYNCTSLVSINIPENLTSIPYQAFYGCVSLSSITIPDSITNIESSAFCGCARLMTVSFPDSVTGIGSSAFRGCSGLTEVSFPDSVTSIGDYAFADCTRLESVLIPDSMTQLPVGLFSGCTSLTSVSIPDSITQLGYSIFSGCSTLESIVIPDSVQSIGVCAFMDCSSLTDITLSGLITVIPSYMFQNCTSLEEITIPGGITRIEMNAFYDCTSLTDVWYEGDYQHWQNVTIYANNGPLLSANMHYKE